jgi:hypothetical protein
MLALGVFRTALAVAKAGWMVLPIVALALLLVALVSERAPPQEARRRRMRHWTRSDSARLGADGIALGESDFIPYREIASVRREGDLLVLEAGRPEPVVLSVPLDDLLRAEELIDSGRQSRARVATDAPDGDLETLLRQGSESNVAWRARIDTLRAGGGYRVAEVDRAGLWRIAQDTSADASARVAACTLLARVAGENERATIAIVRSETAHPEVRLALHALASDTDDRLCDGDELRSEPRSRLPQ